MDSETRIKHSTKTHETTRGIHNIKAAALAQQLFSSHGGIRTYAMLHYRETIYRNQINTLW